MDLDDLRDALHEAGDRHAPRDVSGARVIVGVRAQRRRGRQRALASAVLVAGAIAAIVAVLAIAGGGSGRSAPAVTRPTIVPTPPPSYEPLPQQGAGGGTIAYDAAHGDVVLLGNAAETGASETWLWDGHGWSNAHPAVSPHTREGGVMAYDPKTRTVLLFGGFTDRDGYQTGVSRDLWSWNGANWTQLHPRHLPPWNNGLAMAYDPASKSVILMTLPSSHPNLRQSGNGSSITGRTPFGTWRWDGSDWHELSTPTAPTYAVSHTVYDGPVLVPLAAGRGLLFYSFALDQKLCPPPDEQCSVPDHNGLRWTQTWTWDGRRWTEQHPSQAPEESGMTVTIDGTPTMFGGATYTWTGRDWTHGPGTGGGPYGPVVWDAHDHDVIDVASDTWTWDRRHGWVKRALGARPPDPNVGPDGIAGCRSPQLRLSLDRQLQSVMQQPGAYFAITNVAATACSLDGHPKLIIYDGAGNPIPATMHNGSSFQIDDPGAHRVIVPPGASVYFGFGWTNANPSAGGSTQGCTTIASVAATGPGEGASLLAGAHLDEPFCPPNGFVTAVAPKSAFSPSQP